MKLIQTFNENLKVDTFFVPITVDILLNENNNKVYVEAKSKGSSSVNSLDLPTADIVTNDFIFTLIKETEILENTLEQLRKLLNNSLYKENEIGLHIL